MWVDDVAGLVIPEKSVDGAFLWGCAGLFCLCGSVFGDLEPVDEGLSVDPDNLLARAGALSGLYQCLL